MPPRVETGLASRYPRGGPRTYEADVKEQYLISIRLIERLHRRFLDVIKAELDRLGIEDINNVQTLILFNINEEQLTVGELTVRGYYLGSNVSYNVKKLVENEYLIQERSAHDRRMTRVRLSQKALDLTARISELYQRNSEELAGRFVGEEQLRQTNQALMSLERYWSSQISYGPAFGMAEAEE
jgi:DNA-binding MarR family transcriptional regulator